ncbi:MAG TPA: MFS transporter [Oxalobacteraceae bacterium]|jgi:MFS family permease|nr:MFS transporter [Oxalobacteraceae bacterium]HCN91276.1 MFS transporter [Oxalobacteraceae bacterium]
MNKSILRRLLWVRGLRAFGDGYVSLLLPLYLIALGMSPFQIGVIATGTLLGSGVLTLLVGLNAYRLHYRSLLLLAAALMAGTGLGFATITAFWPLLLIAVVGTLNPSSGDVSVFLPLEHALLSRLAEDHQRTAQFARYGLVGALVAALGALFAGLPHLMMAAFKLDLITALQSMFALYGLLGLVIASLYATLPQETAGGGHAPAAPLKHSKKIVYTLAALFSLDAFGGGFVVQSMIALWLFQKFQLSIVTAGSIFFWTGVCSAFSLLLAVRIAQRIGLVNTMVFTHLPANIFLMLIPFMPSLPWAIALLLARSALSQMDVPTRSSYVMSVVPPEERAAAASMTAVPRSLVAAAGPLLAGYLLGVSSFGWPLVIAGGLKIVYDLLLLRMFRSVRPPEETALSR